MVEPVSTDDLADEHAELLPDREVLSLLTDPTAMNVPSLLGPPQTADAGAGNLAGGMAGDANHLAGSAATHTDPASGAYSPTETSTAG
jgi:hypothetical protein